MKKILILLMVSILAAQVWATEDVVNRENLSLKAGPTQPGEGLSLVWVEALVYPKVVRDEKEISLAVRTTAKIKSVRASFDFGAEPVDLASGDGLSWTTAYKIPEGIPEGMHAVRYQIAGKSGSIQRTVEFYVEKGASDFSDPLRGGPSQSSAWPLTVLSNCSAYVGDSKRILYPGEILNGVGKMTWYKVLFKDGTEGWVSAANVKEPTEDFYRRGYAAYREKNFPAARRYYQNAVAVDPGFVKGHVWLAKTYMSTGDLDAASAAAGRALRLDDRSLDARLVANELAYKYYSLARKKFASSRYREAEMYSHKAQELKPVAVANAPLETAQQPKPAAAVKLPFFEIAAQPGPAVVAPMVADDSLQILKQEKTTKGTRIETAVQSVVSMTRSLGTPIVEKGWQVKKLGGKFLVSYLCEQSGGALESFDWLVDVDTRQVLPNNDNARLLMGRW